MRSRPIHPDDIDGILLRSRQLVDEVFNHRPKGVGKAYLGTNQNTLEDALEIDLRTMLALAERQNRLDRDP